MRLNKNRARRGSALLIVLGMLSFMVISAVAFSAYMRYTRLPSSFLRQASASRLLAKAAVAEAIDEIDAAIGNMPHPGLWNVPGSLTADRNRYIYPRRPANLPAGLNEDDLKQNRNIWMDRVYIGNCGDKNESSLIQHLVEPDVPVNGEVDDDENVGTVSPLCLEALAYVPAPLMNAVRYYSRRSNAAKWHKMAFDAGRFAFCAVDVSDYFDVNALAASVGRSSSSAGRISLAYAFENQAHTAYGACDPAQWDTTFMKNFRSMATAEAEASGQKKQTSTTKVPLVSVADLNLSLYDSAFQAFSPFCQYVANNEASLYSAYDMNGLGNEVDLKLATFVTDGLFPSSAETEEDVRDLCDNQPFQSTMTGPAGGATLGQVKNTKGTTGSGNGDTVADRIRKRISGLGMAELYDYIDQDNVPVSLSIPQVERTPMICGIEPNIPNASVTIVPKTVPEALTEITQDGYKTGIQGGGEGSKARSVTYVKNYFLDADKFSAALAGTVKALVAYPFHRGTDVDNPDAFKIEGHLAVYLATGELRFRTKSTSDLLHLSVDDKNGLGTKEAVVKDGTAVIGVFHSQIGKNTGISLPKVNPDTEEEVVKLVEINGELDAAQSVRNELAATPIVSITYRQQQTREVDENGVASAWTKNGDDAVEASVCNIRPVKENGKIDERFAKSGPPLIAELMNAIPVSVRAAVWLRVKNGDGDTVDLVPACLYDDKTFLNVDNASADPAACDDLGSAYPLMVFEGGSFIFSQEKLDTPEPLNLDFKTTANSKGVMCLDPRWNWAPEHWFAAPAMDANTWLTKVRAFQDTQPGCDRDIFMATSDAGYLQSIYEVAFLPRLTYVDNRLENKGYGWADNGQIKSPSDVTITAWAADEQSVRNANFMWRTYRPYDIQGQECDPFDEFGVVNQGNGVKVNPYSDDTNVVMAAFANTPFDWWAASTNYQNGVQQSDRKNVKEFNKKFAFSQIAGNTTAKFAWNDLKRVAQNFIVRVREGLKQDPTSTWEDAWDWLDWSGTLGHLSDHENYFCTPGTGGGSEYDNNQLDGETCALWDVDRKFLYGYWRECFAARQQLFLIFVRAEPMMMGGGAIGQTPPTLGAKAVALVWRDPTETKLDCGNSQPRPHRTRVLFYRQFE